MASFSALPVYKGVGAYHLNRYRIAFEAPSTPKESLAAQFVQGFDFYLKSEYAHVTTRSGPSFEGRNTLKLWGSLSLLWDSVEANLGVHHDWVVIQTVDLRTGFMVQTLKREFFDPIDDIASGFGGIGAGGGVLGAVGAAAINRYHFLAGRRAWRIDSAENFGQSDSDFIDGEEKSTLILETAAIERLSHEAFQVGDWILGLEDRIPNVWISLLQNYVLMRGFRVRKFKTAKPTDHWITSPSGWVQYCMNRSDTLTGIQADKQFFDMKRLYPELLPAP